MTTEQLDPSSSILSLPARKRKSVAQDPSSPSQDDPTSPVMSSVASAAAADQMIVDVSSKDSAMRQRHRAASRAGGAHTLLPLPVEVVVPLPLDPSSCALLSSPESSSERPPKRPRIDDRVPVPPCRQPQLPPRHRRPYRKRRAFSLPNLPFSSSSPLHTPSRCDIQSSASVPSASSFPLPIASSHYPALRSGTSSPITFARTSCYPSLETVPPLQPLINREALKELDLEAILRNPQLRHDLLFDPGLQFQPTTSRRKRDITTKYWQAIQRELETGCTCTSFDSHGKIYECVCSSRSLLHDSHLGSYSRPMSVRMPSRIKPLITELLEVLLSVISPSPATLVDERQGSTAYIPPTIFQHPLHSAQEAQLRAALDASLIEQELLHGVFDPSGLFQLLGSVLKCHCAPMRDRVVDTMVQMAHACAPGAGGSMGDAVKAIRICFEILELMKLDIANHQLHALRPYLLETSTEFELKTFQDRHEKGLLSLHSTRAWLQKAYSNFLSSPSRQSPLTHSASSSHLQRPRTTNLTRSQQIQSALVTALTEVIFRPPATKQEYPDTLHLDHARLIGLSHEAADLTALYMLLMLYRQLAHSSSNSLSTPSKRVLGAAELEKIKSEIKEVGPARLGLCFGLSSVTAKSGNGKDKSANGVKGKQKSAVSDMEEWSAGIANVMLQLAVRSAQFSPVGSNGAHCDQPSAQAPLPEKSTLNLLQKWATSNLRDGSPLSELLQERVRSAVAGIVVGRVFSGNGASAVANNTNGGPSSTPIGAGLETFSTELHALGDKILNLVTCHWRVYGSLYDANGFLSSTPQQPPPSTATS
ncbi:Tcp11-domain-containing protein [Sistotremastrum suecicum HHB10207 ss-3]|uniref:Tcp11-domain-containing protein n=1 Tax=Sistotremastrum suecicum HHB10207 ss-3 TaxID=1314776 RepID=A0A166FFX1_9AGAM|nr:Tcp11-domain-containing protein [Sistotremastrum suecicum HHB10207 ss-3]